MDYYNTMRTDFIHKAMYPEDPMRVDWIPKGPPQGTLTIKPKDRCAPRIVTKIEGSAVEEGQKVFFEGIVDAKPQPKFNWYFNDEPIFPGQKGWEEAEIHDSRRMSTLILAYAREHHMGKYTLVISNHLGTAECSCDLIVRKKQFPPVFWQRLYNVGAEGSRRFVGGVEVGGWPVPAVFWYKVSEDGTETEVTSRTHTENWNGNPNKYVPSSRLEVKQIDAIRHQIVFHEVSTGDSGTYRVRAVNCLGEAECEADLNFDDCIEGGGQDMYLPPLWREKRRLTWRDEDQRKKPFVGLDEPGLTEEELAEMKMKCGVVPLSRITEYFATLPDYRPTDRFRDLEALPYKPGVDERHSRPDRRGGKVGCFPSKFHQGKIQHHGYNTDSSGRILPWWYNAQDPRARDSSDWRWRPVHPELSVPTPLKRERSPDPPLVWETTEDILALVRLLRSMGCNRLESDQGTNRQPAPTPISLPPAKSNLTTSDSREFVSEKSELNQQSERVEQKGAKVKKFSYTGGAKEAEEYSKTVSTEHVSKTQNVKKMWEEKLEKNVSGQATSAAEFTSQFVMKQEQSSSSSMYQRQENLSFPELEQMTTKTTCPPPALPPKTKIRNSPSRNIFSPTESLENGAGTASIKSVEFLPVREKVKLIAAQQEELLRKEETQTESKTSETNRQRGVRILPPSPQTVRKMSVTEELCDYDRVVTRNTPTLGFLETPPPRPDPPHLAIAQEVGQSRAGVSQGSATCEGDYSTIDSGISSTNQAMSSSHASSVHTEQQKLSSTSMSMQKTSHQQMSHQQTTSRETSQQMSSTKTSQQQMMSSSSQQTSSSFSESQMFSSTSSYSDQKTGSQILKAKSPALSLEQQKEKESLLKKMETKHGVDTDLEQLIAETESLVSEDKLFQQQEKFSTKHEESPAEICRRSFEEAELEALALETHSNASISKQSSIVETSSVQSFVYHKATEKEEKTESEGSFPRRKPLRSASATAFIRTPETFTSAQPPSCPSTPMSQRRRLRINQSPKPPTEEAERAPKYRDTSEGSPFKPGFYRVPEESSSSNPIFKLIRRNNSRSNIANNNTANESVRDSQTSSKAYEGDSES